MVLSNTSFRTRDKVTQKGNMARKMTKTTVIEVPLSQLTLDYANGRSGAWDTVGAGEEIESSYEDFVVNLAVEGQKVAVIARPAKKKDQYQLVVGFRRVAALTTIEANPEWLQKALKGVDKLAYTPGNPVVAKVDVQELTDLEARKLNGLENIGRENLSAPDQAWLINDLYHLHLSQKQEMTGQALAAEFGMSQAYAGRLLKIMQNCKPAITKHWREKASVALTVNEMLSIADLKPAEQQASYDKANKTAADKAEGNARGPAAWVDTAKKSAAKVGRLIGILEKNDLISVTGITFDSVFVETLAAAGMVKIGKKGANNTAMNKIARECNKAYEAAYAEVEATEEKETAE